MLVARRRDGDGDGGATRRGPSRLAPAPSARRDATQQTADATPQERANPPFNIRKLAIKMHGSERNLLLKEKFMAEVSWEHNR